MIILFLHIESLTGLPADPAEPSGQEENMCKICMDSPIDCVLLECGHMVTCSKCGKRMNECPICRQYVVRAVHVFRSWNSGANRQTAHYRLLLFHTLSNILSVFFDYVPFCCFVYKFTWLNALICFFIATVLQYIVALELCLIHLLTSALFIFNY